MYKALNPRALGISGRQSEIIELALTYGFRGIEFDILEFSKRVQVQGLERAKRFLESGHLRMSAFELPMRWRGEESTFESELEKLDQLAVYASAAGAKACHTTILPATDMFPYHENFELHRKRLSIIADALGKHGIRLGLSFLTAPAYRVDKSFQFIFEADALLTLIKSMASTNLGLVLDTWNWHFGGGTPNQLRILGADKIVAVQIADAPVEASKESLREEQRIFPQESGPIQNQAYVTQLAEIGFKGPVSLDPHPSSLTGMTRETIVQKVSGLLDELLKAAGVVKSISKPTLAAAVD
jgi:sugar phosphate isomerase/epimerase